ncbi:MAG: DUF2851 family protein [Dehalococcoidia bacterium]
MGREVDERLLARLWRGQWLDPSRLKTVEGRGVQVVFPGRGNGDGGPDVLDAMVALDDGRLLRGAVELHVQAADWEAHRHHRDPAFNGVVLHVTWSDDLPWVEREDGARVPTLPLRGRTLLPIEALMAVEEPDPPFFGGCRRVVQELGPEGVGELLDRMGEERFRGKGDRFQGELACWPAEEVLYQGLLKALGYSKNQGAFLRLARFLPFSVLRGVALGTPSLHRPVAMAACLLGVAGLLPSQGARTWPGLTAEDVTELEEGWKRSKLDRGMRAEEWHTFRIRPVNHPGSRMMGAGYLLSRWTEGGLIAGLDGEVSMSLAEGGPGRLMKALEVPGYLGRGRATEMVTNVVLPFFWGLGEDRGRGCLAEASLQIFRGLPKGPDNRITRQMGSQLFGEEGQRIVDSARRQQGLIHLFKGPCAHGFCDGCPLGLSLGQRAAEATAPGMAATTEGARG